jgi:hypothetical protein
MSDQPIAWAMPRKDGVFIDVITPEEHARMPGQYTVPLCKCQPKAEQRPPNCGTGFCSCIECPYVQPKAEPQEPVGVVEYLMASNDGWLSKLPPGTKLYAAPQPRRRLTNDEINVLWAKQQCKPFKTHAEDRMHFARAIEAAVWGEKT